MTPKSHWEDIYTTKDSKQVSWFQEHAETSLKLIQQHVGDKKASIIDIGAGASTLVDDLLEQGYNNLNVLDISKHALAIAQKRLGDKQQQINWLSTNILEASLPQHQYDLWHDRAVFHFLTDEEDRQKYVQQVLKALKPNGKVIISTFGPDGPLKCSGLPIVRYSSDSLHNEFGSAFTLLKHGKEDHLTPDGSVQKFIYCYCRLEVD
ncbi:MAG TPA: class I SAM-dependent methyltransferase [Leucothrix mucor]|nr:class I SAM-dependent methyltransferase [Leucothrix mucor]